jgi:hypothetical protein
MPRYLITRNPNLYFLFFLRKSLLCSFKFFIDLMLKTSNIIRLGAKGLGKLIHLVQIEVDYFFISSVVYC